MTNDNPNCEANHQCKKIKIATQKGTYSLYGGKYNIKDKDGNYLMEERAEVEESEDYKNGDTVYYCEICLNWRF